MQNPNRALDSALQGASAELLVAAHLMRYQVIVLEPKGNYTNYDLLADKDGRYTRIQVKSHLYSKETPFRVRMRDAVDPKKYDLLAVVIFYQDCHEIYYIPAKHVEGLKILSFSKKSSIQWQNYLNSISQLKG